jgi:hypothetical protein
MSRECAVMHLVLYGALEVARHISVVDVPRGV